MVLLWRCLRGSSEGLPRDEKPGFFEAGRMVLLCDVRNQKPMSNQVRFTWSRGLKADPTSTGRRFFCAVMVWQRIIRHLTDSRVLIFGLRPATRRKMTHSPNNGPFGV